MYEQRNGRAWNRGKPNYLLTFKTIKMNWGKQQNENEIQRKMLKRFSVYVAAKPSQIKYLYLKEKTREKFRK